MNTQNKTPAVLSLGMFDGVHGGHRALLKKTVDIAWHEGYQSLAYSFANHPKSVLAGAPPMLMTTEEREAAIRAAGVDAVCMDVFTKELASMSPEHFVKMLAVRFSAKALVVGFNYTFGYQGKGTASTLHQLGSAAGMDVHVVPAERYRGETISSSRIRECIEKGDILAANDMLLAPYTLRGNVVGNRHIGTTLGFPTANILPPEGKILPLAGVYATLAVINGQPHQAVTNVGNNPTVQGKAIFIETHVLDFAGDLYGLPLEVQFHAFLRAEVMFASKQALAAQILHDTHNARRALAGGTGANTQMPGG